MNTLFDIIESHWQSAPVPIVQIIRDAGIEYAEEMLDPDVSGYVEHRNGRYRIVTNILQPPVRRRFTAAHELGHYVYHRDLMGSGVSDNKMYRSVPGTRFYNSSITPRHETQANKFAATVLMPHHLIQRLQAKGLDVSRMADRLGVSQEALKIQLGLVH